MKKELASLLFVLATIPGHLFAQEGYPYRQVPFSQVKINDTFWSPTLRAHTEGTIPSAIVQLRDSTARISNFEIAAGVKKGPLPRAGVGRLGRV